jgi:lysophospholipase L1-like esterase
MRISSSCCAVLALACAALLSLTPVALPTTAHAAAAVVENPFEGEIKAFEEADKKTMPAAGGVLFVGSSSIKAWDLESSFPKKGYINRGFGGSQMSDLLYYVDRTVTNYKPRLVVVYAGDNDINAGVPSDVIVSNYDKFVKAVHAKLPDTKIIYIGIKPSVLRWSNIDRVRQANVLLKAYAERNDKLAYIDSDHVFLGWDEKPVPALLDRLHPSIEGLKIWTFLLTPFLADSAPVSVAGEN